MIKTSNIWILCSILALSLLFFELTSVDIYIQDYFYNFDANNWILDKSAVVPKLIFYSGIKRLFILFTITILLALLLFRRYPLVNRYKRGLLIVLLSCIIVPLFIGFLKSVTNVPCPKNIERYGGDYPYVTVLSIYPDAFHKKNNIKCYPAGHASGGFSLMSLFFLFFRRKSKIISLVLAISIGWIIGNYKMIIGDHFFSHTLITMGISWILILCINNFINYFANNHRTTPRQRDQGL